MRTLLLLTLALLICHIGSGQDTISTKDRKKLIVKVLEQSDKYVRYKMIDYADGPVLMMRTNRIRQIDYRNGYVDMMGYQNPRKNRPLGVSAGYAAEITVGGGMASATVDYFLIPQIDLEASIGASDFSGELYLSAGTRLHLSSKYSERRLTPFTGVLCGSYYGDEFIQVPLGVNYIYRKKINASLSVNEMLYFNSWYATFLELRLGWRFKL